MPFNYKILGQASTVPDTWVELYTVPVTKQAIGSTLILCNREATQTKCSVAVRRGGDNLQPKHYIMCDTLLKENDSVFLSVGMSLSAYDIVQIISPSELISATLFGVED